MVPPTWYRISPAWAEAGQTVWLAGSNFSYGQVPTVTVGGVAAQVLTSTAGIVTARLGAGTTHGPIELTNEVGKVTMSGPFTANSGPTHPGFFVVTGPSVIRSIVGPHPM